MTTLRRYLTRISSLCSQDFEGQFDKVLRLLLEARNRKATVYFAGNGGSASTASHMATDLGVGSLGKGGLKSVALSDSTSNLTATGNDYGFDQVFARQLEVLGDTNDVFVSVSASGKSLNLVEANTCAKNLGMKTIGILGFDGGHLIHEVDAFLHVRTNLNEYGPVEDLHLVLNHAITEALRADDGCER